MQYPLDFLLVVVVLLNFLMLGSSRVSSVIRAAASQGVILGLLPLFGHEHITVRLVLVCLGAMVLKGAIIPGMLFRAMRSASIRREVEPIIGFTSSILLGALGTGLAIVFASSLPLEERHATALTVPASFSTVLTGFLSLTTRKKAISQVVGYLTLENGIFIFGLLLLEAMPFLVEIGVLLDLFVGVFVMGIILNMIQKTFSSLDTSRLSALKE
jgi:hydrogenase-4 component E